MVTQLLDQLRLDLRYAARSLGRNPGFTSVAVICLALGIGANTTMFGVVDTLLFRPPAHVRDAGHVLRVYFTRFFRGPGYQGSTATSFPNYSDLSADTVSFSAVAAYWTTHATLGRGAAAQQLSASVVTVSFFPLLGVRPAIGRFFSAEEDRGPGNARVAVLGYGLWHGQFGAKPDILGRTLWIGGGFYTVIGVAPSGFTGADLEPVDVWLPIRTSAEELGHPGMLSSRGSFWVNVLGRLRPGVSRERAVASATMALRRGNAADRGGDTSITASLYPLQRDRGPDRSIGARVSTWVAAAAGLVLLIACANLAGLLLARSAARRRETAVRLALGASRARLTSQLLAETLILAAAGTAAAVLLALWGGAALRAQLLPHIGASAAVLNGRVLAFTATIAVVGALLSAVIPALDTGRSGIGVALKSGSQVGALRSPRGQSPLIVGQVALTLVLLVGTGLFVRSLRTVRARAGGLDVERLLLVTADLRAAGYARADAELVMQRMLDRVRKVAGVERASVAVTMPFFTAMAISLDIPGQSEPWPTFPGGGPYINAVGPDWFATAGTRIVSGRGFTDADRVGAPRVAVVSQMMARGFWPGQSAIGKCLKVTDLRPGHAGAPVACTEVVGVAADVVRMFLPEGPGAFYYVPVDQSPMPDPPRFLLVRASGGPEALVPLIRQALQDAAPDLPYVTVLPLAQTVAAQLRPWRMGTTMFGAFALLGLLLASVGLYGLLTFVVTRRTQEMAVRMALGAGERDVRRLVLWQGLKLALIGVAIGVPCVLALGRALASLLYGVSASDPVLLGTGAAVLVAVAGAATYVPSRRATRLDPALALRAE